MFRLYRVVALISIVVLTNLLPVPLQLVPATPVVHAAGSISVNSLADPALPTAGGLCTLRQAIADVNTQTASPGCGVAGADTITFSGSGESRLSASLVISHSVIIQGPASGITLDGQSNVQLMVVNAGATVSINGLTFAHGKIHNGNSGGINNLGTLTLANSTVSGNVASADNPANGKGAGIFNGGALTVMNSIVSGNTLIAITGGNVKGAGIYNSGTLTVANSTVSGNTLIRINGGMVRGGGIYNDGTLNVTNSMISSNDGGIFSTGPVNVMNSTVSSNAGGGIFNSGNMLTVSNSTVSGNTPGSPFSGGWNGGGIRNGLGTMVVTSSTISGNSLCCGKPGGGSYGGGIENGGSGTLANSTVSDNSVNYGVGGIYNFGTLTVTNSTVSGNTSATTGGGGGIYNYGALIVMNSTVYSNSVAGQNGGGIGNSGGGAFTMTNTTVSGNSGGVLISAGSGSIRNTIVANSTGPNCTGVIVDGGYNLADDSSCGLSAGNNSLPTTAALLDPAGLKDNGGPTLTILPLPASSAVNSIPAGVNGCGMTITTDQRGIVRPQGASCDIGAVERIPASVVTVTSSPNPSFFGESVTITVTVSAVEPANGIPSGTVTLTTDSGVLAGALTLSGGKAVITTTTLPVGSHSIMATYSGDGSFESSSGALPLPQVVNLRTWAVYVPSAVNYETANW